MASISELSLLVLVCTGIQCSRVMEQSHREVLQNNRVYLVENVDMKDVVDHLTNVLSPEMEERIMNERTNRDRVVTFLNILEKRGPTAFPKFLVALTNAKFDFVKKKLEADLNPIRRPVQETKGAASVVATLVAATQQVDWLASLDPTIRKSIVSEKAMTMMSDNVSDVIHVGKIMGFEQGKLQQYQCEHPYSVSNQVSVMFSDWRAKYSSRATVAEFVRLLREAEVDDNRLKVVIMKEYCIDRKQAFV